MDIVYMPGCFDLLHVGHVRAIQRAANLGDWLIIGVPSDETVCEDKGSPPIISLNERIEMLKSLRAVDAVAPYFTLDFIPHLKNFQPSVLAVGSTWGTCSRHLAAEEWVRNNNARMVKIEYFTGESTTKIKQRVIQQWQHQ